MSQTFSGVKASLKLNGVKVAFVGSINVTQENTLTAVDVLDQVEVAELAETGHQVSFTCNIFKVDQNSALSLGFDYTDLTSLLTQPEMVMEIYDRINDKVQYSITGVKWEGGSGSVDARGLWQGSWNFKGRIGGAAAGNGSL
jgi:hypothetical protein